MRGIDKRNIRNNKNIKNKFLVSALLPLAFLSQCICNEAKAENIYAPIPTLDRLHDSGETIPDTDIVYPQSAYTISNGSSSDYNFMTKNYDNDGILTTNYYKTELNMNNLGVKSLSWQEINDLRETNTIFVVLPNNERKYYYYTYNKPANYANMSTINDLSMTINNAVFYDQSSNIAGAAIVNTSRNKYQINGDFIKNNIISISSHGAGGAIANSGNLGNITGNFIDNHIFSYAYGGDVVTLAAGGAIYNTTVNNEASIQNITGNFVGNFVDSKYNGVYTFASGGAIANEASSIENITGNFIGNYAHATDNASGGAITNVRAEYDSSQRASIKNITGVFIDNSLHAKVNSGGAIVNHFSDIDNITGDFLNNSILAEAYGSGGAIFNSAESTINNIKGNFIDNHITTIAYDPNYTSDGGAIYNYGTINKVEGTFINNYVDTVDTAFGGAIANDYKINNITANFNSNNIQSNLNGYGGAISNTETITNGITNSNFTNNFVKSTNGNAYGGAIYTDKNLNIKANNGTSTFKGNYIQKGNNPKDYQAIYVDGNNRTLTLTAQNNGSIYMYDNINGTVGYNVNISGDGTGTLHLYNDIKNGDITTGRLTIDTANSKIHDYNFLTLNSSANTRYNIDVDLTGTNPIADTFTVGVGSSGVITINNINYIGDVKDYTVQILHAQDNSIQLAIAEALAGQKQAMGTTTKTVTDTIKNATNWNDRYENYTQLGTSYGTIKTATTNTQNDSIELKVSETEWGEKTDVISLGDTLGLVGQLETDEARSFNFDTSNDKYNATGDLGVASAGRLSINGVSATNDNTTSRSEINLNGHNGFELNNATTLDINNTRTTGNSTLMTVNNTSAIVNLQNAELNGNISADNTYTLNINGNSSDKTIINGTVGKANATLNGGEVKFNTDTFNDAEFSALNGTVDLVTGEVENYDIGKLTSDESVNWIFEIDSSNSTADTLSVGTGSSGTVTVSEVNFINGDGTNNEFTIKVLDAENDDIQLAIGSELAGENQKIGTTTKTSQDTVTPTAKWNQTFNKYTQNGTNYGNITTATTDTTNDSLQLTVTNTEWDEQIVSGSMGDTLALVNQLETDEDRNFNFDTSADVYNVTSDLGTFASGNMNVNGVATGNERSTINGNNYNLFVLSNETNLNLNNVRVTGANSVVSGTNKNAVINMNNVDISNNASGITTAGSININGNSKFSNNGNGIEVTSEDSIITLNGLDGDGITIADRLTGVSGARLNLKAGVVTLEKPVTNLDVNMDNTTVNLTADNIFNGQNMTVQSASNLNMINNSIGTMQLGNLTLNDSLNMGVDVDLANKSMDRISADTYNLGDNKINVNRMNLLSDAKEVRTDIEFADEHLRDNVTTSVSEVAYSPIYKYGVNYNKDSGEFEFTRSNTNANVNNAGGTHGGNGGVYKPTYNDLNPAVMASPVAAQMGGYAGMIDTYNNAFANMDYRMNMPHSYRKAMANANKYAIASGSGSYESNNYDSGAVWVRPFTAYDSVGLKNGPKVHNMSYGSFIGGDTGIHRFSNGAEGTFSTFVSYLGSHQNYSGNSVYQNGGNIGFAGTLYKGNFFTGLTAGVGANISEANTMYGNEDFPMLTTGVASKTGYNIEFKDGKFIIQPSLLLSYTFVNAFDYKNAAGVRIDTAPLHAVQISPNLKFILNTKNGWQPYLTAGMNWNIMDNTGHFMANETALPELSVKPYVQYGLGLQKLFGESFTGYAQVLLRHGGRNGVGGNLGFRWQLGTTSKPIQEQTPKNVM